MDNRMLSIMYEAFLDNITLGALFRKLRRPGAPTEVIEQGNAVDYVTDLIKAPQNPARRRIHARLQRAFRKKDGEPVIRGAIFEKKDEWIQRAAEDVESKHGELVEHC